MVTEGTAFAASLGALNQALAQRTGAAMPAVPGPDADMIPTSRARQMLDGTFGLLALDLIGAAKSLDQRAAEDSARMFGTAPTAAWSAFRMAVTAQTAADTALSVAQQFLRVNRPAIYYPKGEPPPGADDPIPLAQERMRR